MTQTARLPGIEMLRGVAVLLVVFHHIWSLGTMSRFPGYWIIEGFGTLGVDLFFLLSAYLLADYFWKPARESQLINFYIRRGLRIAPAYYLNIFVLFLFFAGHSQLFSYFGLQQLMANLTFTHYLRPGTSSSLNVNGALWTLTNELILYLLLPAMAWFTKITRGIGAVVLIVLGLGYRFFVALAGESLVNLYFDNGFPEALARLYLARQFMGVLPVFALGIGLRWLVIEFNKKFHFAFLRLMPVSAAICLLLTPSVLLLVFVERASNYSHWLFFGMFDFSLSLLMIPALLFASREIDQVVRLDAAAVWVGERSYGLYLWHFPIILSVYGRGSQMAPPDIYPWVPKIVLILLLTFAAAAISWVAIEKPAQDLGRRLSLRRAKTSIND